MQVGLFNQLHLRSVSKLRCMEIHAGLKARAVVMVHLLHPMLVMIKDTTCGYTFLDQEPFVRRLDELVTTLQQHPESFLDMNYVPFPGEVFRHVTEGHRRWREKSQNRTLIESLFSPQTGASYAAMTTVNDSVSDDDDDVESDIEDDADPQTLDDMVLTFLRAYGIKLRDRLRKGKRDRSLLTHSHTHTHEYITLPYITHILITHVHQACGPGFYQEASTPT